MKLPYNELRFNENFSATKICLGPGKNIAVIMLNELLYNEIHCYEKFVATNIFLPVPVFKTSPLYNEFVSGGSATIILSKVLDAVKSGRKKGEIAKEFGILDEVGIPPSTLSRRGAIKNKEKIAYSSL